MFKKLALDNYNSNYVNKVQSVSLILFSFRSTFHAIFFVANFPSDGLLSNGKSLEQPWWWGSGRCSCYT